MSMSGASKLHSRSKPSEPVNEMKTHNPSAPTAAHQNATVTSIADVL